MSQIKVTELQHKPIQCPFCKEFVELGVLPYHQHLCKKAMKEKNDADKLKRQPEIPHDDPLF